MKSEATTVDQYIAEAPEERREDLQRIREMIRDAAPNADECMRYGHPHWDLDGSLFALASQKHHLSLYVAEKEIMAQVQPRFQSLRGVSAAKSCLRFRRLDQVPVDEVEDLLRDAVRARGN